MAGSTAGGRDRRLAVARDAESFESDRARDIELRLLGFDVVRLTYRQVTDQPAATAAKLRKLLSRSLRPVAT